MAKDGFTIEVDGFSETLKWMGKIDKELRKEAVGVLRDGAKKVQAESRTRLASRPGISGDYPVSKGAIVRRASGKGASVGIARGGEVGRNWAIFGAEFGAKVKRVQFGYRKGAARVLVNQARMRRRTFPVWRGNSTTVRGKSGPGWVVLPTLRKWVPKLEDEMEKDLNVLINKTLRKAGVPRG